MAKFFPLDTAALEQHLKARGYGRTVQYREVVYVRRSERNPSVQVKVYTSVRDGQSQVRSSGKDAIRVCTVFDDGRRSFGIGKFQPVMRVESQESILRRLDERIEEAVERAVEWMDEQEARGSFQAPRAAAYRTVAPQGGFFSEESDRAMHTMVAVAEREAEIRGFESDPDFQAFLASELGDPCSEPPPPFAEP